MTNCSDKQLILVTRQGIEIGEIQNYLSRVYDILKHWQSNINDNVLTHPARDNVLTHPARDNVLTHPARLFLKLCIAYIFIECVRG